MADEKIVSFFRGTVDNYDSMPDDYYLDGRLFFATDSNKTYLYFNDGDDRYNVVPRLLSVVNGGTGATTFASGQALIGNGAGAIGTRAITNNTSTTYITASTNLITANTLAYWNGAYNSSGNSRIVRVGTITGGTWHGTIVEAGYGGTGRNTLTQNGVLFGNGTNALKVTAAGSQGQILSPDSSGVPSFASPSWSWTAGTTAGPILNLSIQSKSWSTTAIPSASGSASGIVTTDAQTFAGVKTFSNTTASTAYNKGAVVIGGGLGVAGNIYSNGNLNMTGTGTFGGDITVTGGDIYLGPSATDRVQMTYANDTLTITFIE